jgi:CheY-like chemotaxis protein
MPSGGFFSVDSLRGVWILVVDSHPRGRETLGEILSYCGALVTPLSSAADALGVMRQVKPDVLIVALADDADFSFMRRVRGLKPEDGGVLPAVAVAGDADDGRARAGIPGVPAHTARPLGAVPAGLEPDDGAMKCEMLREPSVSLVVPDPRMEAAVCLAVNLAP